LTHTTIWIKKQTLEKLKKIARYGDTYDKLINRLLDKNDDTKN